MVHPDSVGGECEFHVVGLDAGVDQDSTFVGAEITAVAAGATSETLIVKAIPPFVYSGSILEFRDLREFLHHVVRLRIARFEPFVKLQTGDVKNYFLCHFSRFLWVEFEVISATDMRKMAGCFAKS